MPEWRKGNRCRGTHNMADDVRHVCYTCVPVSMRTCVRTCVGGWVGGWVGVCVRESVFA